LPLVIVTVVVLLFKLGVRWQVGLDHDEVAVDEREFLAGEVVVDKVRLDRHVPVGVVVNA